MKQVELVGILNITPDSFSDGGLYDETEAAVMHASELFEHGADFIDVGAESTNPKSSSIGLDEEWRRLEPVLARLLPRYPNKISVDTHHPDTVEHIVAAFGDMFMVNDVTGMNNIAMRNVVAAHHLRCIVSHLPARFGTDIKAAHAHATMDDEQEVLQELLTRRQQLIELGLSLEMIILDPGIGFGKTVELNQRLLEFPRLVPDTEVMIGHSRKRFLGERRFENEANLAAARIAIAAGAKYLRVHDVAMYRSLVDV